MPATLQPRPPAELAPDERVSFPVPPAFYSDVPPPPPPPNDPHRREWPPQEPSRPSSEGGDGMSDGLTMRWIMAVFGVTVALHVVAVAALVMTGHP